MDMRSFLSSLTAQLLVLSLGTLQGAELSLLGLEQGLTLLHLQKPSQDLGTEGELKRFKELHNGYRSWFAEYARPATDVNTNEVLPIPATQQEQFVEDEKAGEKILQLITIPRSWNGTSYASLDINKISHFPVSLWSHSARNAPLNKILSFTNEIFLKRFFESHLLPDGVSFMFEAYQDLFLDFYTKLTFVDDENSILLRNFFKEMLKDTIALLASPDVKTKESISAKYREVSSTPESKLLSYLSALRTVLPAGFYDVLRKNMTAWYKNDAELNRLKNQILDNPDLATLWAALEKGAHNSMLASIYNGDYLDATQPFKDILD